MKITAKTFSINILSLIAKSFLHLSFFHRLTEHYDVVRVLFPDHSPEVIHSVSQWSLSQYVLMTLLVSLYHVFVV